MLFRSAAVLERGGGPAGSNGGAGAGAAAAPVPAFYRLDENVAGVYEEGDFFEQQGPEHFVEQGKLLR